jgi:Protein of unknown function (DUF2510)
MQEFESISASSYDPSALATKLTAKAAEGWSVVAIVPTGGDVTAFVTREKNGAAESSEAAAVPETVEETADEAAVPVLTTTTATTPEAVEEPSGWAIAPEPASPAAEPAAVAAAEAVVIDPTPSYQPSSSYQPAAAAATVAAATPAAAATPEPAPTPAVPAGWYADPAGRFELRYWDGSTWTEHVSRAGQQFTDPPVA